MISHPKIRAEIIRRIRQWYEGNPQPPVRLHFQPTDNCNLYCKFCKGCFGHNPRKVYDEILRERALRLVNESAKLGVLLWSISGGGEPTCVPYWLDLLKSVKEAGMYGEINTNATLFTESAVRELVSMGWDHIIVSLDGADAKTHDSLRNKKGIFNRITEAVAAHSHYKRMLNSDLPVVGLAVVLCKRNVHQIAEMVELAHELGCQNISFNPVKQPHATHHSQIVAELELDRLAMNVVKEQIPVALDVAEELGVQTNLAQLSMGVVGKQHDMRELLLNPNGAGNTLLNQPCYEPWYNMTISFNGEVGHCCESPRGAAYANILNSSLEEAWFEHMQAVRVQLAKRQLAEYCSRCGAWQVTRTADIRYQLFSSLSLD